MQTGGDELLFADVGVARADGTHDFAGQIRATPAHDGVSLPAMEERRGEKAVEIIRQAFLKLVAGHCRLRRRLHENTRFELSRRRGRCVCGDGAQSVLDLVQKIVTERTAQSVLRARTLYVGGERAFEVVGQTIFKFHAKHYYSRFTLL